MLICEICEICGRWFLTLLRHCHFKTLKAVSRPIPSPPAAPEVVEPRDGALEVGESPVLQWAPAQGARAYEVFVWRADEPQPEEPTVVGIAGNQYLPGRLLAGRVEYRWQVRALRGGLETPGPIWHFRTASRPFLRGDADGKNKLLITDAIFILSFLFLGGPDPPCKQSADVDDNGTIGINDAIRLLNFLFLGGPEPPPPQGSCGLDPTLDPLDCRAEQLCP